MENTYLKTERIGKILRMFAIPCVLSLIIQSLYNLVDQIYIGHCNTLGAIGNAATGIVYPLTVIALGIGLWLGDGCAACMSLNQGKQDTQNTGKSVGTAIFFGVAASLVLMLICFLFKNDILEVIGAEGRILEFSSEYADFIIGGFLFFVLACVLNPIIRADGSPKYAMAAMAIGAVLNIILDPIFIYAIPMGMTGAALATFSGQLLTFILHIVYLLRTKTFRLSRKDFIPRLRRLKDIVKLGISSLLTQLAIVVISIVNNTLLLQYSALSGYDTYITQGVITLAFKVYGIVISVGIGIASGGQPIIGYNYGAKEYGRVREALKYILLSTLIVGVVATLIFELCPDVFLFIFGTGGEGVDLTAYKAFTHLTFRIYLGFILFTCLIKVIAIYFQAVGSPVKATIISMARDIVFLVPLAILLANVGGIDLFLWSAPLADILGFLLAVGLLIPDILSMRKKKETEPDMKPSEN